MTPAPQEHAEGLPDERVASDAGVRLREAREARKLSCVDVARQLHLEPKLITALEEGDTANLPPAIFVRGYMRNYARLVGVPEGELIDGLDARGDEPALLPNIDLKPQASSRDIPVRLVTYALVVGLVTLALLWWFGKSSQSTRALLGFEHTAADNQAPSTPSSSPAPGGDTPGVTAPGMTTPGLPPESTSAVRAGAGTAAVTDAPTKPAQTSTLATTAASAGNAPEPARATSGTAAANGTIAALNASADTLNLGADKASGQQRSIPATAGVEHQLVLHYSEPSWTEVRDANGRELVYQLVDAGTTLKLGGPAPFTVLLGYSPGVHIEYNGQPFDIKRYSHNNVAHFRVGKAKANTVAPTGSAPVSSTPAAPQPAEPAPAEPGSAIPGSAVPGSTVPGSGTAG